MVRIEKDKRKPKAWYVRREISLSNIIWILSTVGAIVWSSVTYLDHINTEIDQLVMDRTHQIDSDIKRDHDIQKLQDQADALLLRERK